MLVGREKREETTNRSVRLPDRLWALLEGAANDQDTRLNNLFWRIAEDFLTRYGYLKEEDRKREPLNKGGHHGDL